MLKKKKIVDVAETLLNKCNPVIPGLLNVLYDYTGCFNHIGIGTPHN